MDLILNIRKVIWESFSDLEFRLVPFSGRVQFFRRKYLKLMKVDFKCSFYLNHQINIRNQGNLLLGERCCMVSYFPIWNYAPITIGDDFLTPGGLILNSATHGPITLEPKEMGINIGSRVWRGMNVTILQENGWE